jgi:hypothetical protein
VNPAIESLLTQAPLVLLVITWFELRVTKRLRELDSRVSRVESQLAAHRYQCEGEPRPTSHRPPPHARS